MKTKSRREKMRMWTLITAIVLAWAAAAYLAAPAMWRIFYRNEPGLASGPRMTHTLDRHPGDPINIALQGTEEEVVRAMTAAGWFPADPITFATSARIVVDSVVRKPDDQAPVSNLYLFARKEDLAFELPVGNSPRRRHHVRFWKWAKLYEGREAWFGSASFDERVGLSHTTGEVTHHIGPDVDAERDLIMQGLAKAGWAQREYFIDGFHEHLEGRNGGGDLWRTDGRLGVVDLVPAARRRQFSVGSFQPDLLTTDGLSVGSSQFAVGSWRPCVPHGVGGVQFSVFSKKNRLLTTAY